MSIYNYNRSHNQTSNLFKQFDSVDPECDHHWDEKVYLHISSPYLLTWDTIQACCVLQKKEIFTFS